MDFNQLEIRCYINFLIGSAKYIQFFLEMKWSHWLKYSNKYAMLGFSLVFTVFLPWQLNLPLKNLLSKQVSLFFTDLWNQKIKWKIHTVCQTGFTLLCKCHSPTVLDFQWYPILYWCTVSIPWDLTKGFT